MASAPEAAKLDDYRREADRFIAALDEEYYLHFSGQKEAYELTGIYERYADLTSLEACMELAAAAESSDSVTELWRFACEGHLGNLTREHDEEIARLEATLSAEIDGDEIGFRLLRPAIANEPDRGRREQLDQARVELAREHLEPAQRRAADAIREATPDLGADTYRDLYARFGFPLEELDRHSREFLSATEELYVEILNRLFTARLGLRLEEARRWDVPRLFRAPDWDAGFKADAMLPALEGTLSDLGIDLRGQRNVHLDLESRPKKTPRAFCAPIEVPGRIMLVVQPIGGSDDWQALFHEAGHAEHYAHTASGLPVEARRLGDNAVTEGWAALFEHLISDPAWLARRLDFGRPEEFAAETSAKFLYLVRRYCGKFLYELELHGEKDLDDLQELYVQLLTEATKIEPSAADFLADVDSGFYTTAYLRSWGFEAQMRDYLREAFGHSWFSRDDAGALLRELWYEGQSMNADELLGQVVGSPLDLSAIGDRVRESQTS